MEQSRAESRMGCFFTSRRFNFLLFCCARTRTFQHNFVKCRVSVFSADFPERKGKAEDVPSFSHSRPILSDSPRFRDKILVFPVFPAEAVGISRLY
jgi:hypothetical protein